MSTPSTIKKGIDMRRNLLLVAAIAALGTSGIAYAATSADTNTVVAKATKGGTKKKPKAVAASFTLMSSGTGGARPDSPADFRWIWKGVKENGGKIPTCSADQIDAAQSDSVCPKASNVGHGEIKAYLGPDGDKTQNAQCTKQLTVYNSGAGKSVLFATGDPAQCAGVGYLAPIPMTSKTSGTTTTMGFVFPDNISHPLPGLSGAFQSFTLSFTKSAVKKGGKTYSYLSSTGCKGKRGFTFTEKYAPESGLDPKVSKASAGAC